jgi:hypothetical protein
MIAVVSARLETTFGTELLASEDGLQALAQALAELLGGVPTISRQTVGGQPTVLLQGPRLTVVINAAGVSAQSVASDRVQIERVLARAREVGEALAIPLAQERVVQSAAAAYGRLAILSDTRQGAARVTRIRIPL